MYGCESWTIKKAEHLRIDAFELWCWRRLLRVPWTAKRSNQSILKEISPGCSLEGMMLRLKLQYFGPDAKSWLIGKDPDAGKDWRQEEKGATEDEMIGWHHWVNGHEFEQALGDSEGQGIPVCCSPWGCKESNTTEQLNSDNHVEEEMGVKRSLKTTGPTRVEVGLSSVQLSHLSACCQIFFLIHSIYHSLYSSYEGLLFLLL